MLESIELPNNLESIGNYAFNNCTMLESIEMSNSVAYVGSSAFGGCDLNIYCEASAKPSEWSSSWNIDNCPVAI